MDINTIMKELKKHHKESYSHSFSVANLSMDFVTKYIPVISAPLIYTCGLLHDIGKLYIPSEILTAPRKLTSEEFEIIKKHPEYGVELLKEISLGNQEQNRAIIENCIIAHHINTQNSYPNYDIEKTVYANIISICDCYSALASKRDYKEAMEINEIINIMNNNYDEKTFELFSKYIKNVV